MTSARRRMFPPTLLLAAAIVMGACDDSPADRLVGIQPGNGDSLEIRTALCPEDEITGVRLLLVHGTVYADDDDELLWAIESVGGSTFTHLTAGEPPPGFTERVPFSLDIDRHDPLAVLIDGPIGTPSVLFSLDELREGSVYSQGEYFTEQEFLDQASEAC